jgi:large subunit ribosomal protein L17
MRHRNAGKKLSRTSAHRRALRRNLAGSLIEHGAVRTTRAKAKEVRPFVERLISIARQGTLHARRRVIALLGDRAMVDEEDPNALADQTLLQKLFNEVAPRYADRPGGYTRIIHLPERRIGDASQQVLLQLVEAAAAGGGEAAATASRRKKRAARRAETVRAAVDAREQGEDDQPPPEEGEEEPAPGDEDEAEPQPGSEGEPDRERA